MTISRSYEKLGPNRGTLDIASLLRPQVRLGEWKENNDRTTAKGTL